MSHFSLTFFKTLVPLFPFQESSFKLSLIHFHVRWVSINTKPAVELKMIVHKFLNILSSFHLRLV